ncbi:sulfite exporter TauE/SafE family protein [Streptomyces sp. NBC_00876]|uniref:sulfite exporter TauE/SafE family protein n=1 Tax=Streptomyces sp. NBC_00876 TaxID=2975853 RepID=UPI00386FEBC7|nr:sulfite exporter TauE/SafE family protein [Streptomyces sp. NBC_00876]
MADLLPLAGTAVGVFLLAALAQAVTGFGAALVAVPLLALVVDPVTAVVAATMAGLVLTAGSWRRERVHVDGAKARRLALAGVLGMPLGLVALALADEHTLSLLIGGALLVLVGLLSFGVRLPEGSATTWTAGVVSGGLLTSTGMNGPPLVLALQGLEPRRYRATLQAVFCGQDVVAVTVFVALGHVSATALLLTAAGVLGLPLGWAVGDRVFRRVPAERFRPVVLGGLTVIAVLMLAGAS